jgi:hypothetical protein
MKSMNKIGMIVGIFVLLMIVCSSMVTAAEPYQEDEDLPQGGHDYNDADVVLSGPVGRESGYKDDSSNGQFPDTIVS